MVYYYWYQYIFHSNILKRIFTQNIDMNWRIWFLLFHSQIILIWIKLSRILKNDFQNHLYAYIMMIIVEEFLFTLFISLFYHLTFGGGRQVCTRGITFHEFILHKMLLHSHYLCLLVLSVFLSVFPVLSVIKCDFHIRCQWDIYLIYHIDLSHMVNFTCSIFSHFILYMWKLTFLFLSW